MNKRQKEILQGQLDSEKKVLKQLEKQYKEALNEINDQIRLLQSKTVYDSDGIGRNEQVPLNLLPQSRIYQIEHQKALKGQIQGILDRLHGNEYQTISDYLQDCYTDSFVGTAYDLAGQGIPLIMPIDQAAAVKAIQTDSKISEGLYDALGVDTKNLKKAIAQEATRGVASGMTFEDIARNISNVAKAPLANANRIARTEGHRIQQASAYDAQAAAKTKGADVVKQWDSTLDGATRDTHRKLDGQIREVDEPFEMDGKKAMYPGDFGDPAEDCNCRCASLTRARWGLDESELDTLKERAKFFGLDKTKDFEDFKEKYLKAAESESQYGVRYGENAIDVDFDYINSEEYKEKFSKLTDNADVNNSLYKTCKDILKHCDGTEHEDMYLINARDGGVFAKVTDTAKKSGVVYTDEFESKLIESKNKGIPIIGIHNHPQGTPPSPDDFRKAFDNGYKFGIIPGHNGQLYRYETPSEPVSKEVSATINRELGIALEGGVDVDRAFQTLYNVFGLVYTIIEGE